MAGVKASLVEGAAPQLPLPVPFADIPFEKFVLDNGLTLIVHEDHRVPMIATELRFKVGSKDEPAGRHGFAHLFEHFMFKGSANRPGDWHSAVAELGAIDVNGTTNTDRTNYYQTVPTGAIDTLLWMEADRMGHLLGGLTPDSIASEIEVVKNEKRQREGGPMGGMTELLARNLYPAGHPYHHTTLGEFEDLDAVTMETARDWFTTWYGAANAVLVLSGDITPQDALEKVQHWFGSIPSGRIPTRPSAWTLPDMGNRRLTMIEDIPTAQWIKLWTTPKTGSADGVYLSLLAGALTGTTSTPLRRRLVERERLCHGVDVGFDQLHLNGVFSIGVSLRPGTDVAEVEAIIDEELARLMETGPSIEDMDYHLRKGRVMFSGVLESLPGKASVLIESECTLGAPDAYRGIDQIAQAATPDDVARAARRWLSGNALTIDIQPAPRYGALPAAPDRTAAPKPLPIKLPTFPNVECANLSNGVAVQLVHRPGSGSISALLLLQGGSGHDAFGREGLTGLAIGQMAQGTRQHAKHDYRAWQRLLNAKVHARPALEHVSVSTGVQPNAFVPVMKMMAEYALEPAYPQVDFDHDHASALQNLRMRRETTASIAARASRQLTFGVDYRYTREHSGTLQSIEVLTRDMLVARHAELFRPAGATLFLVGDIALSEAMKGLEEAFGKWDAPGGELAMVEKPFNPRIGRYLVDGPGEQQSTVSFSVALPELSRRAYDNGNAAAIFNHALGGAFGSRLNRVLRQERGWTYGVESAIGRENDLATFGIGTRVQADKTIETVDEIERQLRALTNGAPITVDEVETARQAMLLPMPGQWSSNGAVLQSLVNQFTYGLPDGWYDAAADRLMKVTVDDVAEVAAIVGNVDRMNIVVGGDATRFDGSGFTAVDRNQRTI